MSVCAKLSPRFLVEDVRRQTSGRLLATLTRKDSPDSSTPVSFPRTFLASSSSFSSSLESRLLFTSAQTSDSSPSSPIASSHFSPPVSSHFSPPVSSHFSPPAFTRPIDAEDPNFRSLFTPELRLLSSIFRRYDHELRIAGGAVRDLLMGRCPGDVDFATTATPAEMLDIFEAEDIRVVHDRGAAHGTLMVRVNDKQNFEVTTSRIHVEEEEENIGKKGFSRQFTRDWYLDSCQRDLTINAMFLTLDGQLVDYHRGEEDLREGRVAFVGDPRHRIREDHQRILRYFRFHAQLAGGGGGGVKGGGAAALHDEETLDVIRDEGPGLRRLAGMRILPEIKKILNNERAGEEIRLMWSLGLFPHCGLPDDVPESKVEETARKFENSFDLRPRPLTSLSPLFSRTAQVKKLCQRTANVSKTEQSLLTWIIAHRDRLAGASMKSLKDAIVDDPHSLPHLLELLKLEDEREKLGEMEKWSESMPVFPVNAFHLMKRGFEGGEAAHRNLSKLKEIWKEGNYVISKDELLNILETERTG